MTLKSSLRIFLERYPRSELVDNVRFKLAFAHFQTGDFGEAAELLNIVLDTGDRTLRAEVQYWLGESLYKLGNYRKAVTEFLKVPYLYPDIGMWGPTAEFRAAQTYARKGDHAEARKLFEKIQSEQGTMSRWGEAATRELERLEDD